MTDYLIYNSTDELVGTASTQSLAERMAKRRAEQLMGSRHYVTHNGVMIFETKEARDHAN